MKISKSLCSSLLLGAVVVAFAVLAVVLLLSSKNLSTSDVDRYGGVPLNNNPESHIAGNNPLADLRCVSSIEEKIVRGSSLSGLIEDGKTVRVLFGYYLCNEPQRGEVVLYRYAGDENPLLKVVRAVPGDTFHLVKEGNVWQLIVNGKVLTNTQGIKYQLDEQAHRMLSLYENDYRGVIPPGALLILGNSPEGSLDSTRFGLVDKSDILGKVE